VAGRVECQVSAVAGVRRGEWRGVGSGVREAWMEDERDGWGGETEMKGKSGGWEEACAWGIVRQTRHRA